MELRRVYSTQEGLVRYWADQAVDLCREIDDDDLEEFIVPVQEAQKFLLHDRRIIVIGGGRCGKSSLLAGLAGAPAIAGYERKEHYVCWRFSCRDGDATCSRFIPLNHLNGLELVDTADCSDDAVRETCGMLLHGSDVVIAVVDGRSPEASPVWDVLSTLPKLALDACLLVVTFTDKIGAEAAVLLKDTLRDLCMKRLKIALPSYFITAGAKSAMEVFRARVQEALQAPYGVRAAIRALADRASELIDKQSRILRARHSASQTMNSFISGIDQEIDNILSHQMMGLNMHRQNLDNVLRQAISPLLRRVRGSFGWVLTPTILLRLELMGAETDRALYGRMEDAVQHLQAESDKLFVDLCSRHWRDVRPRMKKTLECEIGDFPESSLETELGDLRKRLCSDLYEPFANTGLRHRLFRIFIAHAGWMRACLIFQCFLLTMAGAVGFMGQDILGMCCVASALLVWLGGTVGCYFACRHICKEVMKLAEQLCDTMDISMRTVLERLIVSRVAAYRRLYIAPRQKVARQDATLEPLQQRQKNIHIQLRSLMPRL